MPEKTLYERLLEAAKKSKPVGVLPLVENQVPLRTEDQFQQNIQGVTKAFENQQNLARIKQQREQELLQKDQLADEKLTFKLTEEAKAQLPGAPQEVIETYIRNRKSEVKGRAVQEYNNRLTRKADELPDGTFKNLVDFDGLQARTNPLKNKFYSGPFKGAMKTDFFEVDGKPSKEFKKQVIELSGGDPSKFRDAAHAIVNDKIDEFENTPSEYNKAIQSFYDFAYNSSIPGLYKGSLAVGSGIRGLLDVAAFTATPFYKTLFTDGDRSMGQIYGEASQFVNELVPNPQATNEAPLNNATFKKSKLSYLDAVLNNAVRSVGEYVVPGVITGGEKTVFMDAVNLGKEGAKKGLLNTALAKQVGGNLANSSANKAAAIAYETLAKLDGSKSIKYLDNILNTSLAAGAPVYASYYDQLRQAGYSEEEAASKAADRTAINILTESIVNPFASRVASTNVLPKKILKAVDQEPATTRFGKVVDFAKKNKDAFKDAIGGTIEEYSGSLADAYQDFRDQKLRGEIDQDAEFDWRQAMQDAVHEGLVGFVSEGVLSTIGGHGRASSNPHSQAIAQAISDRGTFNMTLAKQVQSGKITEQQGRMMTGFLNTITPHVEQAVEKGMKPDMAVKYAVETERLREVTAKLEQLRAQPEIDVKKLQELQDKQKASAKTLVQLASGTYIKGRTLTSEEMKQMAEVNTPNGLKETQKVAIAANGPYKAETIDITQFAEELKPEIAIIRNPEIATQYKTLLDPLLEAKEEIESKYRPKVDKETGFTLIPKREKSEKDAEELAKINAQILELKSQFSGLKGKEEAIGFTPKNEVAPVVNGDQIIDGKKRIAHALANGETEMEVVRPLTNEEADEIVAEETDNIIGTDEPDFEGLNTTDQEHLEYAVNLFDLHEDPAKGYASAVKGLIDRGVSRKKAIDLLERIQNHSQPKTVLEQYYNSVKNGKREVKEPKFKGVGPGTTLYRGGEGIGFATADRESAEGYADGGVLQQFEIKPDAKILYLVSGTDEDYRENREGVRQFVKIIGKDAYEGTYNPEDKSDITEVLWGESEAADKLREAGIDIVVGNSMDGVVAFVVNPESVKKGEPKDATIETDKAVMHDKLEPASEPTEDPYKKHNRLAELKKQYNALTEHKQNTKEGSAIGARIAALASQLGYTVSQKKGRMSIFNEKGKDIRTITPKKQLDTPPQEEIDFAKKLIESGIFEWNGDPYSERIDIDVDWSDIRKGIKDIAAGKMSTPAIRLIKEVNKYKEEGEIPTITGTGGMTLRGGITFDEIFPAWEDLTPEELAYIAEHEAELAAEYDAWFESLSEEDQNEHLSYLYDQEASADEPGQEGQADVPDQEGTGEDGPAAGAKSYEQIAGLAPNTNTGRIPVDPIIGQKPKGIAQIILDVSKSTKQRLFFLKPGRRRALGTYSPGNSAVKIKFNGDLDTTAHEIGHSIDDLFGLLSDLQTTSNLPLEMELMQLAPFGSKPQKGHPNPRMYKLGEGFAEWLRAYIANPTAAKQFPNIYNLYESKASDEYKKALEQFSTDFREFAGASNIDKTLANVQFEPKKEKTIIQQLFERAEKGQFNFGWWDKVAANFSNPLQALNQANKYLKGLKGIDQQLPEEDPTLLARLLLGVDGKVSELLESGMVDAYGKVLTDNGTPKNLKWLLEPLDNFDEATIKREKEETVAYMISERAVELADRLGRRDILTGTGGGIYTDYDVAKAALDEFNQMPPEKLSRLKEAARRYRELSDDVLKYMVEKGRLSKDQYDLIKKDNTQYVALQRIVETEPGHEVEVYAKGGNKLASKVEVIKKIKGSSKTIQDPYISLLDTIYRGVRESDRNEVLKTFRDMLVEPRGMYDGTPARYADIGVKASQGDKETITIFVDGKPEYWKFDPEIYKALKGLDGEAYRLPGVITALPRLLRWSVTHWPIFGARNIVRDTQDRLIKSNNNSLSNGLGLKDLIGNKEHWHEVARMGGLNAGYYMKDKNHYYGLMQEAMNELAQNRKSIILDPSRYKELWHGYTNILSKSETVNRVAEYRAAYRKAKAQGMDDYNAKLFAAYNSRDLLDFALMGHWMKVANQIIPFSNAAVQGLRSSLSRAIENPAGFAMRIALLSLTPAIVEWLLNHMDEDEAKQYEELPDYQRDMFYNFKIGDNKWASVPKPYELSIFGAAMSRSLSLMYGNEKAFGGYAGSVAKSMSPFDQGNLAGPLQTVVEGLSNYDFFRDKNIIPPYEQPLNLVLRDTERASRLGKALQEVVGIDARKLDHFIKGTTSYVGNFAVKASNVGRDDGEKFSISDLGFFKQSPAYNSKSVQEFMELASGYGLSSNGAVREFRRLAGEYFEAETDAEKERLGKILVEYAQSEVDELRALAEQKTK